MSQPFESASNPLVPRFPKPIEARLSRLESQQREAVEDVLHQVLRQEGTPVWGSRFDAVGKIGHNWYAIHDEDLLVILGAAVALAWALYKAYSEHEVKPEAIVGGAIALYLKVRKSAKLTREQGVVLLALKAADLEDGATPSEVSAALPDDLALSAEDVERILNELSCLRCGDNKLGQFVASTNGRWHALDV